MQSQNVQQTDPGRLFNDRLYVEKTTETAQMK